MLLGRIFTDRYQHRMRSMFSFRFISVSCSSVGSRDAPSKACIVLTRTQALTLVFLFHRQFKEAESRFLIVRSIFRNQLPTSFTRIAMESIVIPEIKCHVQARRRGLLFPPHDVHTYIPCLPIYEIRRRAIHRPDATIRSKQFRRPVTVVIGDPRICTVSTCVQYPTACTHM